jgi:rhodanese-related sulfurtransferase
VAQASTEPSPAPPLLLDYRSTAEQAVSTLPGACCVTGEADAARVVAAHGWQRPVVVYCAVGVRSTRLAAMLQRAGCADVFNLERSIFGWANAGLPLARGLHPARQVHPYDAAWAVLLDADRRAPVLR